MTPKVFIVQQPTGRDPDTAKVIDTMDLTPVNAWGEPVFLLHPATNPFTDLQGTAEHITRHLAAEQYQNGDLLCLVGNPILIGLVTAAAAQISPRLRFLQWQRRRGTYELAEVMMPQPLPVDAPSTPA